MRFTPKTDDDLQKEASKFGPWPVGVYDFEIMEAEDKTSAKGNEMLVLTLRVYNVAGDYRTVFDYLLEAIAHKLKHAAEACGLGEQYAAGQLDKHDFFGKTGRLKLAIDPGKDGFPPKNIVRDYVPARSAPARGSSPARSVPAPAGDLDDEIPF